MLLMGGFIVMTDKYDIVILLMSGSGVFGGGERLYLRMVRWLCAHDFRTVIMYNSSANIVPELLEQFDANGAERIIFPDLGGKDNIPDFTRARFNCPENSQVKIICIQSEYNFFAAQMIQRGLPNCECDVVHYVIHQNDYCRFQYCDLRMQNEKMLRWMISSVFRVYYRRLVERMERNGSIIYCLNEYAEHIHEDLKIKNKGKPLAVVRLGINAGVFDERTILRRYQDNSFLVVATARLEFPEKGFLLGLVDEFEAILARRPEARLIIVGDGPHREELAAKVVASPAAKAIEMVGAIPYKELVGYINRADLYVSNGTGPLDAARVGCISVATNFFTTECLTDGYWCDDPDNLGYHGSIPVREMILKTMDMSKAEYLALAHRTYDTFLRYYGMDNFMEQMLAKRNISEKPLLSRGYLLWSKLLRVIMNIGLRIAKK